ncbi:MAG: HAD-IA family hydrolase [Cohaesibacteraceae bacterium]|nr:HAD-IA family hydrolase [Cohaesibacteraceae bacterium]
MNTRHTIVYDLDGTLVDTAPDLCKALNHVLELSDLTPIPLEKPGPLVAQGARAMIQRGLAVHNVVKNDTEIDFMFDRFLEFYEVHCADQSKPYMHIENQLGAFNKAGFIQAVCTNKLEFLSIKLLKSLHMHHHFAAICGQDTFRVRKPHPDHILKTIAMAGGSPDHAVMVGDSTADIQAAKSAGIPVIAVDFGYSDVPVAELAPDLVISDFRQLDKNIADLMPA